MLGGQVTSCDRAIVLRRLVCCVRWNGWETVFRNVLSLAIFVLPIFRFFPELLQRCGQLLAHHRRQHLRELLSRVGAAVLGPEHLHQGCCKVRGVEAGGEGEDFTCWACRGLFDNDFDM